MDSNILRDVIARYRRGADGKTPWERETHRRWSRQNSGLESACLFVKQWRESTGRDKIGNRDLSRSGMRATMRGPERRWLDFRRCQSWKLPKTISREDDGWHEFRGLPLAPPGPGVLQGHSVRHFYVLQRDIAKSGATPVCKACTFVFR